MKRPDKFMLARYFHPGWLLVGCLLSMPAVISGKTDDINKALHIEADSVEIREQQGISIYKGHVSIHKGSMYINGELIQITARDNDMYIIDVEGKPARFKQLNDDEKEVSAQSQKMSYSSETGVLTLDNEAILIQGQNQFTSEHIVYDTKQDIVQAGKSDTPSSATEPERVSITIQPKQEKSTDLNQP